MNHMPRFLNPLVGAALLSVIFLPTRAIADPQPPAQFNILHEFGKGPAFASALIQGIEGNFYGTTVPFTWDPGTVFKMTPSGIVTILHSFSPGRPADSLTQGADGNFYGTTFLDSTVFKMTPAGALTILHAFNGGTEGVYPAAPLIQATDGNFYGTTSLEGAFGQGTLFKLMPAGTLTTLHAFAGTEGSAPGAALIQGTDGNFYGTTTAGGAFAGGTVFRMAPDGALTVLHAFGLGADGAYPAQALVEAGDGSFFGTTYYGGNGQGTVFRITSAGDVTVLYAFSDNNPEGSHPTSFIRGTDGNFYGTTSFGGVSGTGTVFKITADGFLTVLSGDRGEGYPSSLIQATDGNLYGTTQTGVFRLARAGGFLSFGRSGANPHASLVQATDGNFYGTTSSDGDRGKGTIFRMNAAGTVTVLIEFSGVPGQSPARGGCPPGTPPEICGGDGANPQAGLIQASDGNFYGTTYDGGSIAFPFGLPGQIPGILGRGTIFKITPAGLLIPLHVFNSYNDGIHGGANPEAALMQATDGAFYGTTRFGGGAFDAGTVFKLTPSSSPLGGGTLTILHAFAGGADGAEPRAALIQATDGNFYGTTAGGGAAGQGTVFRMAPDGTLVILHAFDGGVDGANPRAALVQTTDGNFYGTTAAGAAGGRGTVFTMTPDGTVGVLPAFRSRREGAGSTAALIQAADGAFYGTTGDGGAFGAGVLFRVRLSGRGGRGLDLNGDGAPDVFLHNAANGMYSFQTKSQPVGFDSTLSLQSWDPGWQVYPAKLDGDTFSDVFLYHSTRGIWIQALNAGNAAFSYTSGSWDRNWTVVPADLDGDGLTDMFVYNVATGVWVKCFVDGRGGFKGYAGGNWDPGWTFSTADLNGDGRDDFFLYNRVNGVWVEAFSQAGFGTFDYPASGQWDPGWQVYPADFNGDGRTDLFLLNGAGVHVSALSRASGGFDYAGGPQWSPGWSVSAGDLNNDGTTDLFLYSSVTGVWVEAFSDGAGSFTYASGQWDPGWSVAMTDFNEDGRVDLILSRADGTWVQATNTSAATFTYASGNWGTGWTVFTIYNSQL